MTVAQISILTGGALSFAMGVFHTRFYALFGWTKEFESLKTSSRKVLYSIHIALLLLFFGFAALSFADASELAQCKGASLGITLMYSLFWLWRTVWHVTYLRPPRNLASTMKPAVIRHYVLLLVFALLCCAYAAPLVLKVIGD